MRSSSSRSSSRAACSSNVPDVELQVIGRRLSVDVADAEVRDWITRFWDFPATAAVLDAAFDIRVVVGRSSESPDLVLESPEGTVTLTLTAASSSPDGAEFRCSGALIGLVGEPFRAWRHVYRALAEAMAASGLLLLHTAVVARGGRTLALCAPSGVGKSTTAMIAAARGWTPLAEDIAWLDPVSLIVVGADRHISLREPSLPVLAELHPHVDAVRSGGVKTEVGYDSLGGRCWTATLTDVVDLRRDERVPSAWSDLDRARTVMTLLQATGVPALATNRDSRGAHLAAIASRVRGRRLVIGSTPLPL